MARTFGIIEQRETWVFIDDDNVVQSLKSSETPSGKKGTYFKIAPMNSDRFFETAFEENNALACSRLFKESVVDWHGVRNGSTLVPFDPELVQFIDLQAQALLGNYIANMYSDTATQRKKKAPRSARTSTAKRASGKNTRGQGTV